MTIRRTLINIRTAANITKYHIKINLPKNHHSKIHNYQAITSCKKGMPNCQKSTYLE